jgi:hypothetical protein
MSSDTPTAPPAEPGARPSRPAPREPKHDPLHVLLHYLYVIGGDRHMKIDGQNAPAIFAKMKLEFPNLERADVVFAAFYAGEFARQLRALEWRLRGARGEPIAEARRRKGKAAEAPAGPVVDADGGVKVVAGQVRLKTRR